MLKISVKEQHLRLKKQIGGWAYRALCRGKPLQVWRRSTPHNWFIEGSKPGDYLWHSWERERLDLSLFRKVSDSDDRICQYWGSDSGAPALSLYVLKTVKNIKR